MGKDDILGMFGKILNPGANYKRILKSQNLLHEGKTSRLSRNAGECIEAADKQVLIGLSKMLGFDDQKYERQKYIELSKAHYNTENIQMIFSMLPEDFSDTIDIFIKKDGILREISRFDSDSEVSHDHVLTLCSVCLCFTDTTDAGFMPADFRMPDIVMEVYRKNLLEKNKNTMTHIRSFINLMGIAEIDYMHENLKYAYDLKSDLADFSKLAAIFAQLNHGFYLSDHRMIATEIYQDEIASYLESRKKAKDAMDKQCEGIFFFEADIIETYADTSFCVSNNLMELCDLLKQEMNYELTTTSIMEISDQIRFSPRLDFPKILDLILSHELTLDPENNTRDRDWFGVIAVTLLNAINDMRAYRDFSLKPRELPFQFLHTAKEMKDILPEGLEINLIQIPDTVSPTNYLSEIHGKIDLEKAKKSGRNDPCPCGSGKKYKKCCGVM
ncbi:hypothetical protein AGMMS49983_03000 [Clostridia bacterium]|nr:hypothetical protein AGMMS49983_03000 [Clostridia bacterium]